jgi:hypothetical protein
MIALCLRASCYCMAAVTLLLIVNARSHGGDQPPETGSKPRLVVLTDISNEPDDEESLVRLLVYANEFDIEALIATTSTHLKKNPREDIMRRDIEAYAQVRNNLLKHAPGYPTREALLAVTGTGQTEYGMAAVGDGKSTPGSQGIIEVVDRDDPRPVWVSIWGGANTLAQALWDVRAARDTEGLAKFVEKLRVYTISDQDDGGYWLRSTFPSLFYIVAPSVIGGEDYWKATWTGISGDRWYKTGVMHRFELVDNPWLQKHVIQDHGSLGALYPPLKYIMEGDTPSFLGLIDNGLGWQERPDYGGWGGRYREYQPRGESRKIWTETVNSRDTVTSDENGRTETSHQATVWRWREHFQDDFAARMDWCVADEFKKANHNPIAVLNGDTTKKVVQIRVTPGETVQLSAEGTHDPDGDTVEVKWWVYREAGTFKNSLKLSQDKGTTTSIIAPKVKKPETLHIILEVNDNGTPKLWSYRRAVITIQPTDRN